MRYPESDPGREREYWWKNWCNSDRVCGLVDVLMFISSFDKMG